MCCVQCIVSCHLLSSKGLLTPIPFQCLLNLQPAGCTQLIPYAEPLTLGSEHQQPRIAATRTVEARD